MQFLDLKGDKEKQKCWGEITAPSVRQMVDKPMIISPGVYVHFYFWSLFVVGMSPCFTFTSEVDTFRWVHVNTARDPVVLLGWEARHRHAAFRFEFFFPYFIFKVPLRNVFSSLDRQRNKECSPFSLDNFNTCTGMNIFIIIWIRLYMAIYAQSFTDKSIIMLKW